MSGVFGVADPGRRIDVRSLIDKMAVAMAHRDWFMVDRFVDHGCNLAFGRIGIGIFNKTPQPVWNSTCTVALVMAGELYNRDSLGRSGVAESDEKVALALYERLGDDFASQLNGVFIIAIWDKTRNCLLIANDRFGLYPLYYAHYDGKLIFAPEMRGILCDPRFRKELDLTALAEYIRFQQLLGEKTFFEGISVLPHASLMHYAVQGNRLTIDSYWDFSDIAAQPVTVSFEDAVEETGRLLRQAVNRLVSRPYRIGVYLSGGLDSRTILGLIDREHFPVTSITYGQNKCRDVVYGEKIARSVGSDHHWFEFKNGEWVKEHADFHLELTEGFHSWIHAHGISTLTKARSLLDVNLTGWGLDTLAGGYLGDSLLIQAPDDLTFVERLFHLLNQKYTWPGIDEAESRCVYTEEFGRHVVGRAFESLLHEVQKLPCDDNEQRAKWFMTDTHDRRLTHNFLVFKRSHFENRYPSRDYAFFEFCWSLPMEFKYNRQLQRSVISRMLPKLARIPYDKDELLLTDSWPSSTAHALVHKLKRRFNRHIFPLFPERATLYADYENYLRNELRSWDEGILFDNGTLERGIFSPQFLRSIWDRHLSGRELHTIGKIAPIMTYEMMLRKFFD